MMGHCSRRLDTLSSFISPDFADTMTAIIILISRFAALSTAQITGCIINARCLFAKTSEMPTVKVSNRYAYFTSLATSHQFSERFAVSSQLDLQHDEKTIKLNCTMYHVPMYHVPFIPPGACPGAHLHSSSIFMFIHVPVLRPPVQKTTAQKDMEKRELEWQEYMKKRGMVLARLMPYDDR